MYNDVFYHVEKCKFIALKYFVSFQSLYRILHAVKLKGLSSVYKKVRTDEIHFSIHNCLYNYRCKIVLTFNVFFHELQLSALVLFVVKLHKYCNDEDNDYCTL